MSQADEIIALAEAIPQLVKQNITSDGRCLFDPIKTKLALELVKFEIEKSVCEQSSSDN